MDFLKEILEEELYSKLEKAINEHNGNEANKENQIKLGNLGKGEYVSAAKFKALQDDMSGKDTELTNANNLITELKKASKGNGEMEQKFTAYEAENARLQEELKETKIKSAVKVSLLSEHCSDVDYVTYKLMENLKEKGTSLELDENDNIKGWDDMLSGLKTQLPAQFKNGDGGTEGLTPIENKGLPKDFSDKTVTKEQFASMGYNERLKLKQENEQLYRTLAKH